jgi:polyhydroxybutyrate depolymerase
MVVLSLAAYLLYSFLDVSNGEIVSADRKRAYLLYVPESYDPSTPAPLVISLHGFAEWPAHFMHTSRWKELADEHGFILVFPSGTGFPKRWYLHEPRFSRGSPEIEIAFISDLIDELAAEFNIDTDRVFVNGFSNGAGLSFELACSLSDRVTAIGTVAGLDYYTREDCDLTRPVPIVAFHGTQDRLVPYSGEITSDINTEQPQTPNWLKGWAERYSCDPDPVQMPPTGEVSGIRFTGCQQDVEIHFYTIHGGGHTWPGGAPIPKLIVGHTTDDINASAVMWDFFSQYSLSP